MDDEQKRAAARERMRRYREKLKQDPAKLAAAIARQRERQQLAYWANHDKFLQRQRAYVQRNRDLVYARNREYAAKNRDKIRAQQHETYLRHLEANRAKDRERGHERYAKDPKAHNDYMKRWRAANSERARAYVRLAGHRRRSAAGGEIIKVEDWLALLAEHDGRCAYCGVRPDLIEADHRIPLSRGGKNTIANILPACRRCNRSKWTKTEVEYRLWLSTQTTESLRVKATDSGTRDGLAEGEGPYRTARSTGPRIGSARSRSRCLSQARQGDRPQARDRRRCSGSPSRG